MSCDLAADKALFGIVQEGKHIWGHTHGACVLGRSYDSIIVKVVVESLIIFRAVRCSILPDSVDRDTVSLGS